MVNGHEEMLVLVGRLLPDDGTERSERDVIADACRLAKLVPAAVLAAQRTEDAHKDLCQKHAETVAQFEAVQFEAEENRKRLVEANATVRLLTNRCAERGNLLDEAKAEVGEQKEEIERLRKALKDAAGWLLNIATDRSVFQTIAQLRFYAAQQAKVASAALGE